jgi:hypothetical protein
LSIAVRAASGIMPGNVLMPLLLSPVVSCNAMWRLAECRHRFQVSREALAELPGRAPWHGRLGWKFPGICTPGGAIRIWACNRVLSTSGQLISMGLHCLLISVWLSRKAVAFLVSGCFEFKIITYIISCRCYTDVPSFDTLKNRKEKQFIW